jgi:hypothetical protein
MMRWAFYVLALGLVSCTPCYGHGHHGGWGRNVIIISPSTPYYGGYYNNYNPYVNPNYSPYYYYPQYRCVVVPRCYPSGSCNYQNQECGYY